MLINFLKLMIEFHLQSEWGFSRPFYKSWGNSQLKKTISTQIVKKLQLFQLCLNWALKVHAIFQGYSQNCWIPWDPIRCSKMHKNAVRNSRNWGWEKYLKKRLLATWVLQGLSRFFYKSGEGWLTTSSFQLALIKIAQMVNCKNHAKKSL